MEWMDTICRLCLKSSRDKPSKFYDVFLKYNADVPGDWPYSYIKKVIPQLALSFSKQPMLCQECYDQIKNFNNFKKTCLQVDNLIRIYKRQTNSPMHKLTKLNDVVNYWKVIYANPQIPTEVGRDILEDVFGGSTGSEKVAEGLTVHADIEESDEKAIINEVKNEILLGKLDLSDLIDSLDNYVLSHVVHPYNTLVFILIRKSIIIARDMDEALLEYEKRQSKNPNSKKYSDLIILQKSHGIFRVINMNKTLPVKVLYKEKSKTLHSGRDALFGRVIKDKVWSEAKTQKDGHGGEDISDAEDCSFIAKSPPTPHCRISPVSVPLIRVKPMAELQEGQSEQAPMVAPTERPRVLPEIAKNVNADGNVAKRKPRFIIRKKSFTEGQQLANPIRSIPPPVSVLKTNKEKGRTEVESGGMLPKICEEHGVCRHQMAERPRSPVECHLKELNNFLRKFPEAEASTAGISLNPPPERENTETSDADDDNVLTEQELFELDQDENTQFTLLAVKELLERGVVNLADGDDSLVLEEEVIPWEPQGNVECGEGNLVVKQEPDILRLEDEDGGDRFRETEQVQSTSKSVEQEPRDKQASNTIDLRSAVCKTKRQIQRDRKRAADSYSISHVSDILLRTDAGNPLSTKFTGDGDYVNDHDYLRGPYARSRLVADQFCVCMLCGQKQLGRNHVKHMKTHDAKCRLCDERFDNIFRMNLHAYTHCFHCYLCRRNVFYYNHESHSKLHGSATHKPRSPSPVKPKPKRAAKNAQKRAVEEPDRVLKLLLSKTDDNTRSKSAAFDGIWNSVNSASGSSTESASSADRNEDPLTITSLLNSSVVPVNPPLSDGGSNVGQEAKLANPGPDEIISLTGEETEEPCGKTHRRRYAKRALKSVDDILADIERDNVGKAGGDDDYGANEGVLDSSELSSPEASKRENSPGSQQEISKGPRECAASSPHNHVHNTRSKTPKKGKTTKRPMAKIPANRKKRKLIPDLSEPEGGESDEKASTGARDGLALKTLKIPLIPTKVLKKVARDDVNGPKKPKRESATVERSVVNFKTKKPRKSLLVSETPLIQSPDESNLDARVVEAPSPFETKSGERVITSRVQKSDVESAKMCQLYVDIWQLPELEPPKLSPNVLAEPKRSSGINYGIFQPEDEEPPNITEHPEVQTSIFHMESKERLFVPEEETPWILKTKAEKSSEAKKASNEEFPKVDQTFSLPVLIPHHLEEPKPPNVSSAPKRLSNLEIKSGIRRKSAFAPRAEKSGAASLEVPETVHNRSDESSLDEPLSGVVKRSETPSILEPKSRERGRKSGSEAVPSRTASATVSIPRLKEPKPPKRSKTPAKDVFLSREDSSGSTTNTKHSETASTSRLKGRKKKLIAEDSQASIKKPSNSPKTAFMGKNLVVLLERYSSLEALRLAYMVEQLQERSLQAMEAQRRIRALKISEERDERPKSTTKTPEKDQTVLVDDVTKSPGRSRGPLFGDKVKPISRPNKQKTVDPPKVSTRPEQPKLLSASPEAIERSSEETIGYRTIKPSKDPPIAEDIGRSSSTSLTDNYEVALPENLTLLELFPPGENEDLGFPEGYDVDVEG